MQGTAPLTKGPNKQPMEMGPSILLGLALKCPLKLINMPSI